ncbi:glycosyltransferase family 39 protein [Moheibacter lacus]|uniref:Glycosyltransferase family 39 protein n=1 Tax=Moheibacter lacus TaxID=2745851 RepID=A0A838ZPS5_9FLAO|nr:glycosyltransferase family 39 protein [Moheibacter lacus]MBA5629547.1 glycosyltransferase family 39 protein [Moheibacter lacus]
MPDKRLIYGILILFLVNLAQAFFTPISEDEAYYWLWSQNLDWGYFDHPPMVAWWISVGYEFFQNELGVRLLTVIFNSLSLFFLWKILNPKTQSQIRLFYGIIASVLVFQVFGFLTTPDAPLLFFTIFYLFSLKKFLEKNSTLSTILLAISFAGLMYSKYHGVLVIVFTLLPIIKIWWRNPKFYLAVLGSLVLYAPHIFWLFENDWIPIQYHFLERSSDEHFEFRKFFNYLGIYFLGAAPLLTYFIWKSIFQFKSENSFQKSIWWLAILPGIFFFFSIFKDNVQPQWLLISFIAMALVLYFHYQNRVNLKWILNLSYIGILLMLILRTLLILPEISPFEKNKNFAEAAAKFNPEFAIFEKYQEASIYKFYNPQTSVAVHRTLGNRKSQFTLWGWEDDFYGKTITYISPWVKSENSFKGYKNRNYYLKEISNYQPFDGIEIETIDQLKVQLGEEIELEVKIINHQKHPISIAGKSDFQLNINYYKDLQYEIEYAVQIPLSEFILKPNESKELKIKFKNIEKKGEFKACLGLNYQPIGTSYLSKPILISTK